MTEHPDPDRWLDDDVPEDCWPDDMRWEISGASFTERQFQEAWRIFQETGVRPDWWDQPEPPSGCEDDSRRRGGIVRRWWLRTPRRRP